MSSFGGAIILFSLKKRISIASASHFDFHGFVSFSLPSGFPFFPLFIQPISVNWHCFVVYFVQKMKEKRPKRPSIENETKWEEIKLQVDEVKKQKKRKANKRRLSVPDEEDSRNEDTLPKIASVKGPSFCSFLVLPSARGKTKIYLKHYHPPVTGLRAPVRLHNASDRHQEIQKKSSGQKKQRLKSDE